ncbi:hypothetical protein COLO4_13797 [Corchorus olitorius]|uniref:Uncharacterized protein n=1 Tax=Corchorus olitorius TaxID=93759 RepID=A0A1R3JV24_9ROSI|nr:hypothetical protein COLO4_13797 [Corchorus olitorius]
MEPEKHGQALLTALLPNRITTSSKSHRVRLRREMRDRVYGRERVQWGAKKR